ncbi:hypothetical protein ACF1BP_27470 [Streptomyces sp. NPDC014735]|uniref:hypothetical protein n=1 Tax=unclassified Streptomyces TaxID=2593676 RepID=UPI0037021872
MLQCTALTNIPEIQALVALTTMPGGPDNPPDTGMDGHALCELGAQHTQHAAHLWAVDTPTTRDLWLFWTSTGEHRTYRLAELPPCPATLHNPTTGSRSPCMLYDHHPTPHSWHITDPLRDLLVQQVLDGGRRTPEETD